jgi:hypothetical protein
MMTISLSWPVLILLVAVHTFVVLMAGWAIGDALAHQRFEADKRTLLCFRLVRHNIFERRVPPPPPAHMDPAGHCEGNIVHASPLVVRPIVFEYRGPLS